MHENIMGGGPDYYDLQKLEGRIEKIEQYLLSFNKPPLKNGDAEKFRYTFEQISRVMEYLLMEEIPEKELRENLSWILSECRQMEQL